MPAKPKTTTTPPLAEPDVEQVEPDTAAEVELEPGGWYRNAGLTDLTLVGQPSMTLRPSQSAYLPYTPAHRDLVACDPPPESPPTETEPATADADTTEAADTAPVKE